LHRRANPRVISCRVAECGLAARPGLLPTLEAEGDLARPVPRPGPEHSQRPFSAGNPPDTTWIICRFGVNSVLSVSNVYSARTWPTMCGRPSRRVMMCWRGAHIPLVRRSTPRCHTLRVESVSAGPVSGSPSTSSRSASAPGTMQTGAVRESPEDGDGFRYVTKSLTPHHRFVRCCELCTCTRWRVPADLSGRADGRSPYRGLCQKAGASLPV